MSPTPLNTEDPSRNVPPPAEPEAQPFTTLAPAVVVPALLVLCALLVFCGFFTLTVPTRFSRGRRPGWWAISTGSTPWP